MREIISLNKEDFINLLVDYFPKFKKDNKEKIEGNYQKAKELFLSLAEGRIIISEISIPEFSIVYNGEGLNHPESPIKDIFPKANYVALFACTVGKKVSKKIEELFKINEFLLGGLLDEIASFATDKVAEYCENYYYSSICIEDDRISLAALRYSPGYCGWHISSQKKLFDYLAPEEIGIILNDDYLMQPLKSISGAIIVGTPEIHYFEPKYEFCKECKSFSCKERIKGIMRFPTSADR